MGCLTACGGGAASSPAAESAGNTETSEESVQPESEGVVNAVKAVKADDKLINFEPSYIAVDDDNLKLEFTSLSKEIHNEGMDAEYYDYKVNYIVTNKSDEYDLYVSCTSSSIGQYTVEFANTSIETKAGKINDGTSFTCIQSPKEGTWSSKGAEHIASVDDLLNFETEVSISAKSSCILCGQIHAITFWTGETDQWNR